MFQTQYFGDQLGRSIDNREPALSQLYRRVLYLFPSSVDTPSKVKFDMEHPRAH